MLKFSTTKEAAEACGCKPVRRKGGTRASTRAMIICCGNLTEPHPWASDWRGSIGLPGRPSLLQVCSLPCTRICGAPRQPKGRCRVMTEPGSVSHPTAGAPRRRALMTTDVETVVVAGENPTQRSARSRDNTELGWRSETETRPPLPPNPQTGRDDVCGRLET